MRALLLFALLAFVPSASLHAGSQDNAVVALHYGNKTLRPNPPEPCFTEFAPTGTPCADFSTDTAALFTAWNVYVVVARAEPTAGVARVSFGIQYGAFAPVFGWTQCADQTLPEATWPASGTGATILWDENTNCQQTQVAGDGVHALAGAFYTYAYADDTVELIADPNQAPPAIVVGDCSGDVSTIVQSPPAAIGYGTLPGSNPCFCPIPETNCCIAGQCQVVVSVSLCESMGGVASSACAPCPGCEPVPVERASWGLLKRRFP